MPDWEDFKYEHPALYRGVTAVAMAVLVSAMVVAVPDNDATRAMGLMALRDRGRAACGAMYWETRAGLGAGVALSPQVHYGFVTGADGDGAVLISVPENQVFVARKVKLANIRVTDLQGEAALIKEKRQMDARVELYGDAAVIWIEGTPLNLALVSADMAVPDPNPPTNIVDRVFATHLWNKVKGNKE
ncbi:hypothetical protein [Rugamonas aquatica]|uniref:Uncharacterized protein n=1 Tax=Rugamonas aquatica TaxID=2743357 RepID=A0A6A7N6S2_9BURK|nr:hypothetical protein [Rugamonas aquatica]MQA40760.1 hypothetical protein [Rugamonas aquatica]